MAKSKAEFIAEGRARFLTYLAHYGSLAAIPPAKAEHGTSWQAKAFREGWDIEQHLERDRKRQEALASEVIDTHQAAVDLTTAIADHGPVQSIAPTAGEILDAGRAIHAAQVARMAPEQRRAGRIECMVRGYISALQWSTSDDDNASLEDMDLSPEAQAEALALVTAFYDANATDLGAYADLRGPEVGRMHGSRQQEAYSFAGHDLWLTAAGHGVGFWDRGHGRLGERLTKAAKAFSGVEAYVSDAGYIELSVPYHAAWKRG